MAAAPDGDGAGFFTQHILNFCTELLLSFLPESCEICRLPYCIFKVGEAATEPQDMGRGC